MYLYKILSEVEFVAAFNNYFGGAYKDSFTYESLRALYEHLTSQARATGEPIELDIIAICCEYSQTTDTAKIDEIKASGTWYKELSGSNVISKGF